MSRLNVSRRGLFPRVLTAIVIAVLPRSGAAAELSTAARASALKIIDGLGQGDFGLLVADMDDGHPLLRDDDAKPFIPASNVKLFTAAAALDLLGPDFRYTTELRSDAPWAGDGVLHGNLYLVGSGDPSLHHDDLHSWAENLRARGLRRIDGAVVGDESFFTGDRLGLDWDPSYFPWYYAMESSALSLGRNQVDVIVIGTEPGKPAAVRIDPPDATYLQIDNRAVTAAETAVTFDRRPGSRVLEIGGTIRADAREVQGMSVPDPCLYTAYVMTEQLQAAGIEVAGAPATGRAPAAAVVLWRHQSEPLTSIVAYMDKHSDNHTAEQLIRTLGAIKGREGSAAAGAEVIMQFLAAHGIDTTGCRIVDGSGLSRSNRLTPGVVVSLLLTMNRQPCRQAFIQSLSVAGEDGTLSHRMRGLKPPAIVRGKTGSMHGVCSLSGYLTSGTGATVAFAFLANSAQPLPAVRAMQDRFCAALIANVN